jgi:hypothetical protein
MGEGGDSNKLLIITARHVVLPPNKVPNDKFERKNVSGPRFNVLLLSDKAYENYLTSIRDRIGEHGVTDYGLRRIDDVKGRDDKEAEAERKAVWDEINAAEEAMDALYTFFNDVKKDWAITTSRVLGHVVCSPPICLGAGAAEEQYTEDYAIIEVDDDKIDQTDFKAT